MLNDKEKLELATSFETDKIVDDMIAAGVSELLKQHPITYREAKEIILLNIEFRQKFSRIITSNKAKVILEFAKNNPLNETQLKLVEERMFELGKMAISCNSNEILEMIDSHVNFNALCDFAVEFQDRIIDMKRIEEMLFSCIVDYSKKDAIMNFIMNVKNISFENKIKMFLKTSSLLESLHFISLTGVTTSLRGINTKNEDKYIFIENVNKKINEIVKKGDAVLDFYIEMFNTPFKTSFLNTVDEVRLPYGALDGELPETITLNELFLNNPYIKLFDPNLNVLERLKEAKKNRYAFKPGEAGLVEHSGTGVSRILNMQE